MDASEKIKADYTSICKAYESMLKKLKPGVKFSELYDTVRSNSLRDSYQFRHGLRDSAKCEYPDIEYGVDVNEKNRENNHSPHIPREYSATFERRLDGYSLQHNFLGLDTVAKIPSSRSNITLEHQRSNITLKHQRSNTGKGITPLPPPREDE